jgi:DedD protein
MNDAGIDDSNLGSAAAATDAGLADLKRRNRRRLVGAATIAAVIAVVFPLLFKVEERVQRKELDLTIPTPNAVKPLPAPSGAAELKTDAKTDKKATDKKSDPAPAKPEPPKSEPTKVEPAKVEPAKVSVPAPVTAAAPAAPAAPAAALPPQAVAQLGSFAVQLASLKDQESAKRLGNRVRENDLSYFFERVATAQGELIRVRAGPFKTKADAEKAQKKLEKAGIKGSIVNMQ